MAISPFKEKVLKAVNKVPYGRVASYGQIALMVGVPKAAQAVGNILHDFGDRTPWWRIVNNAGRISTKCPEHTPLIQKQKLEQEGLFIKKDLTFDIEKYRYRPEPAELKDLELDERYIEKVLERYFYFL
ncbi:protein containing Methylated-DNA-[protein]-cysteine S-methyltransferase, DNA binding domain [sediment metagenome]|uniref:Protein containing Methylated-DNA-[protein]-cysteine S-methyltransferase, DNA binding domain n=1 Tax=sediment metagenome TaxID=749907 RepID=D9PHK7_9ZZZZ